jgi:hypothetical protein
MFRYAHSQTVSGPVTVDCRTTKHAISKTDTADHVIRVWNKRKGDLYDFEATITTLLGKFLIDNVSTAVTFGPAIIPYTSPFSRPTTTSARITVADKVQPGSDEITTHIEFFDSSQRSGSSFVGSKEPIDLQYTMDFS